jgi:hypothetical protein
VLQFTKLPEKKSKPRLGKSKRGYLWVTLGFFTISLSAHSFLWYVGSPQSREEHDRQEEKIDFIIKRLDPENAQKLLDELDDRYPHK